MATGEGASATLRASAMATIKLGELLIKANVLQESQLKAALAEQQKWGGKLGEILVRMSLVTEDILVRALSKQLNVPSAPLDSIQGIPPHVKSKIPVTTARDYFALPLQLRDDGKTLVVAMVDPQNVEQIDALRAVSKCRIVPQLAGRTAIARAFARFYEGEADLSDFEGSFKVVDSQGRTVVKSLKELERNQAAPEPAKAPIPQGSQPGYRPGPPTLTGTANKPPPPIASTPSGARPGPPVSGNGQSPSDTLRQLEDVQRKEVAAIKAMVELLIERGVFTREEYLAKVKR